VAAMTRHASSIRRCLGRQAQGDICPGRCACGFVVVICSTSVASLCVPVRRIRPAAAPAGVHVHVVVILLAACTGAQGPSRVRVAALALAGMVHLRRRRRRVHVIQTACAAGQTEP
jgi:MYXO-CTERM domain-containing protein